MPKPIPSVEEYVKAVSQMVAEAHEWKDAKCVTKKKQLVMYSRYIFDSWEESPQKFKSLDKATYAWMHHLGQPETQVWQDDSKLVDLQFFRTAEFQGYLKNDQRRRESEANNEPPETHGAPSKENQAQVARVSRNTDTLPPKRRRSSSDSDGTEKAPDSAQIRKRVKKGGRGDGEDEDEDEDGDEEMVDAEPVKQERKGGMKNAGEDWVDHRKGESVENSNKRKKKGDNQDGEDDVGGMNGKKQKESGEKEAGVTERRKGTRAPQAVPRKEGRDDDDSGDEDDSDDSDESDESSDEDSDSDTDDGKPGARGKEDRSKAKGDLESDDEVEIVEEDKPTRFGTLGEDSGTEESDGDEQDNRNGRNKAEGSGKMSLEDQRAGKPRPKPLATSKPKSSKGSNTVEEIEISGPNGTPARSKDADGDISMKDRVRETKKGVEESGKETLKDDIEKEYWTTKSGERRPYIYLPDPCSACKNKGQPCRVQKLGAACLYCSKGHKTGCSVGKIRRNRKKANDAQQERVTDQVTEASHEKRENEGREKVKVKANAGQPLKESLTMEGSNKLPKASAKEKLAKEELKSKTFEKEMYQPSEAKRRLDDPGIKKVKELKLPTVAPGDSTEPVAIAPARAQANLSQRIFRAEAGLVGLKAYEDVIKDTAERSLKDGDRISKLIMELEKFNALVEELRAELRRVDEKVVHHGDLLRDYRASLTLMTNLLNISRGTDSPNKNHPPFSDVLSAPAPPVPTPSAGLRPGPSSSRQALNTVKPSDVEGMGLQGWASVDRATVGSSESWNIPSHQQGSFLPDHSFRTGFEAFGDDPAMQGDYGGIIPPYDQPPSNGLWQGMPGASSTKAYDQSDHSSTTSSHWNTPSGAKTGYRPFVAGDIFDGNSGTLPEIRSNDGQQRFPSGQNGNGSFTLPVRQVSQPGAGDDEPGQESIEKRHFPATRSTTRLAQQGNTTTRGATHGGGVGGHVGMDSESRRGGGGSDDGRQPHTPNSEGGSVASNTHLKLSHTVSNLRTVMPS
ncbi:hypothetical protein BKA70DRAFT_1421828 [Coprinopsis sp. MPI-PUGE-AT-0042]|nr:hypothetical protein BKA70DRAFT_1421828 [Coprinopsis sp. MPI-PUGE-AT-0042]